MKSLQLDVVATRGSIIESRHLIHAAVVDARGCLIAGAGDPTLLTHSRSCSKPFQVMPLLESGGFDELRWGDDQLALACGSHGGEPEHVAICQAMLNDMGLEEGDLVCGPHEPLSPRGSRLVRECGARLSRMHNNCSGKHAAMLARAHTAGWSTYGYERTGHQVQQSVLGVVAEWTGVSADAIGSAVDGCGVVEYALPLDAMARGYAKLAGAAAAGDDVPSRVLHAMVTRPFLVGGTDRFDTLLIEECDGCVIAKIGAEGVHAVAVPQRGLGMALKVGDGGQRAQYPAVLRLLQLLDVLPTELPPRLNEFLHRPVRNSRNEVVGEVRPVA
jgi:L-asparaginase II